MLHCHNLVSRKGFSLNEALKLKQGFSLIELLVVVAIIGVLAAVAIPAYNSYRTEASQSSLKVSLRSIGKAHTVCRIRPSMNTFTDCNSLSGINVTCEDCGSVQDNSGDYPLCVHADDGTNSACLQVDGQNSAGNIFAKWEDALCCQISATYTCTSNAWVAPTPNPCGTCTLLTATTTAIGTSCTSGTMAFSCKTATDTDTTGNNYSGTCGTNGKCK